MKYKKLYCKDCGKLLARSAYLHKTKKCMSCNARQRFKDIKNHPRYKKERHAKYYCVDCGALLNKEAFYYKTKRCKACSIKYRLKNPKNHPMYGRKGLLCPAYIDGRSFIDYPPEFNDTLKYKIRERDNFECQNCGMTEEEHIIVWGQVLHVHHIDYNKLNSVDINLVSTCMPCNARANFNRKSWELFYKTLIKKIYATIN